MVLNLIRENIFATVAISLRLKRRLTGLLLKLVLIRDLMMLVLGRVYSTGLQGQVWQKTQVSQGKIFSAFCYHNKSPNRGIIKIHLRQHLYLMLTSK